MTDAAVTQRLNLLAAEVARLAARVEQLEQGQGGRVVTTPGPAAAAVLAALAPHVAGRTFTAGAALAIAQAYPEVEAALAACLIDLDDDGAGLLLGNLLERLSRSGGAIRVARVRRGNRGVVWRLVHGDGDV
jgi:hypothetical protein